MNLQRYLLKTDNNLGMIITVHKQHSYLIISNLLCHNKMALLLKMVNYGRQLNNLRFNICEIIQLIKDEGWLKL
jgi:hypothetical protein